MFTGLTLQTILGASLLLALLFVVYNNMRNTPNLIPDMGMTNKENDQIIDLPSRELDGVLKGDVGTYHKVEHNNKFICTDCNNCAPAQYRNDVNLRCENLENVRRIRALRGDPYPTYQL